MSTKKSSKAKAAAKKQTKSNAQPKKQTKETAKPVKFAKGSKVKFHEYRNVRKTFTGEIVGATIFSNNKKTAYRVKTKDGKVHIKSPASLSLA